MDDDFNTPEAIAVLFDLAREINRLRDQDKAEAANAAALLRELAGILGLMQSSAEDYLQGAPDNRGLSPDDIEKLIAQRTAARTDKNWAESDRIRDLLKAQGVVLEDSATGTSWRSE